MPQGAPIPPGHQADGFGIGRLDINPRAIAVDGRGQQLVQKGQVQTVGQVAVRFEFSQELFDEAALRDDDNHRLQFTGRLGENLETPDDLIDRQRRELFQLQLDHRAQFLRLTGRQVNDAQEDLFDGHPGDVQLFLPERAPVFGDQPGGQWTGRGEALLGVKGDLAVAGAELPKLSGFRGGPQNVAGTQPSGFHVRLRPVLSCVPRFG